MPEDNDLSAGKHASSEENHEESILLLSDSLNDEGADRVVHLGPPVPNPPSLARRQSSLSRPAENGSPRTPRTANRVHFDIAERASSEHVASGHPSGLQVEEGGWIEEDDYLAHHASHDRRNSAGQRAPLLTDIEAPSVTVASVDLTFNAEDLLEGARPKSGMRSAFMNMANSIM
ncbi:MAG: hypothetical protein LQ347_000434 [Umbilicaria vellea]|nr:MAG: hypothetical protein LQ347_000434 [Umbilicaria vellea]